MSICVVHVRAQLELSAFPGGCRLEILNPVVVASLGWLQTCGIKAHKPARCSLGGTFQASFEDTVTDGRTSVHIVHMGTLVLIFKTRQAAHSPGGFPRVSSWLHHVAIIGSVP